MKRILVALAVLALTGCAATSETSVKHGKRGLHINCSGLSSSWNKCYAEATSLAEPRDTG
ncbi:putative lipoprotein [Pseudomonas fragi]|uniref:Putative lipoprotein n=1 Tax=Pseudomonas fragi TaxID=296 RepID=A0A449IK46_PSEFR|nr:putative lipoprotein [Pseudomonas fragi]